MRAEILEQFISAINRLEEALKEKKNEYVRDACIQRFEVTFELAWKTIKRFAKQEGMTIVSPKEAFRYAFKHQWIKDEKGWLHIIEARNLTVHTYNQDKAEYIYDQLEYFLALFKDLAFNLQEDEKL
ncbi:HI0074 family nucleotidyltransferase substrate-binding subunit [bacterium]